MDQTADKLPLTPSETTFAIAACTAAQEQLVKSFDACSTIESKYEKIIEMGRELAPYPAEFRSPAHIVEGCQSILYLHPRIDQGKIFFTAASEALISAGLAALLITVYSGQHPIALLKCPPLFLEKLGIHTALTPGRSNGLASMYLRMKQHALAALSK